jgi:hypothetical protein
MVQIQKVTIHLMYHKIQKLNHVKLYYNEQKNFTDFLKRVVEWGFKGII